MGIVLALVLALGAYAAIGALFAVPFLIVGIGAIDPAARQSPKSVRLLFAPGVVAVWPLLLVRWARGRSGSPTPPGPESPARVGPEAGNNGTDGEPSGDTASAAAAAPTREAGDA